MIPQAIQAALTHNQEQATSPDTIPATCQYRPADCTAPAAIALEYYDGWQRLWRHTVVCAAHRVYVENLHETRNYQEMG